MEGITLKRMEGLQERATFLVDDLENQLQIMEQKQGLVAHIAKEMSNIQMSSVVYSSKQIPLIVAKRITQCSATIDARNIVGTAHPDYKGMSWADLIRYGKRMHINIPLLKENPKYYVEEKLKEPTMLLTQIDDDIYIDGDGNHRSALAKFIFENSGYFELHGVTLTTYQTDREIMRVLGDILGFFEKRSTPVIVNIQSTITKREDDIGIACDIYSHNIAITNLVNQNNICFSNANGAVLEVFLDGIQGEKAEYRDFLGK